MIEARIKLAKAMGWQRLEDHPTRWFNDGRPSEECRDTERLPDPFTDANDDYAVRDFMIDVLYGQVKSVEQGEYHYDEYISALGQKTIDQYVVGDIARAACVGLQIELPPPSQDAAE